MRDWNASHVARAAGAELVRGAREAPGGPARVVIDSREVGAGDLFVGLKGEQVDGGAYARQALEAGAWGVLVAPEYASAAAGAVGEAKMPTAKAKMPPVKAAKESYGEIAGQGVVLACEDPLKALQDLAEAWLGELREQGARVIGITGSTGKTSTKDITAALLEGAGRRTVASPENRNTEIGLPLTVLEAPKGTQVLVLEMAMRGRGQIAQLTRIARPDVGVIVNVGPVHVEQLGSVEGVVEAKAELIEGLSPGATAVVPADEPRLERYRREGIRTVTFGLGGDVRLEGRQEDGREGEDREVGEGREEGEDREVVVVDRTPEAPVEMVLKPEFQQEHNLKNLQAAVAAVRAVGVTPEGEVRVRFSKMRGQRKELPRGIEVIEDCYNANPMSMRAAIDDLLNVREARAHTRARVMACEEEPVSDDLPNAREARARTKARARTHARTRTRAVAVLGDMLELGKDEQRYHSEIGEYARKRGVDVLVTVGERARAMAGPFAAGDRRDEVHSVPDARAAGELLEALLEPGDTVLVKGSRGVGLERTIEALAAVEPVGPVEPAEPVTAGK